MSIQDLNMWDDAEDAATLCKEAGRDPEEKLTAFVMADFAGVVLAMEDLTREQRVNIVAGISAMSLGDSLCDASGWTDILETRAQMALEAK